MQDDPYSLERFVAAQDPVFDNVCAELRAGHKRSHWMWFIFPQIQGLGRSEMARTYALSSLDEARAYLQHPVLAPRLIWTSQILADLEGRSAAEIFGSPDDMKFHSSMTLFSRADPAEAVFAECLKKYFAGRPDTATLDLLAAA
jgi:uncharacterized protein (DUF1810 family)